MLGEPTDVIVDLAQVPDEAKLGGRVYIEPIVAFESEFIPYLFHQGLYIDLLDY